jgi:hypothetical protein
MYFSDSPVSLSLGSRNKLTKNRVSLIRLESWDLSHLTLYIQFIFNEENFIAYPYNSVLCEFGLTSIALFDSSANKKGLQSNLDNFLKSISDQDLYLYTSLQHISFGTDVLMYAYKLSGFDVIIHEGNSLPIFSRESRRELNFLSFNANPDT